MKSSTTERFFSGKTKDFTWKEDIPMKGTTNPLYAAIHERRASVRPQPNNTVLYEIKPSDSLSSVAAHFNTTPSELVNLNRLISRTLFAGQIIYVPDTGEPSTSHEHEKLKSVGSVNGQKSPKPGHVERVPLGMKNHHFAIQDEERKSPSQIAEDLNAESQFKFLKINAKHITDGEGVVSGVLLVTPNHLMFDPNVSDPLIIEHGSEKYGVVAPMYMVVRAALYPDIVRMRIKNVLQPSHYGKRMQPYCSSNYTLKKSRSHDDKFDIEVSVSSWEKEDSIRTVKSSAEHHPPLLTKISECSFDVSDYSEDVLTENEGKDAEHIEESPPPSLSQESESESFAVIDRSNSDPAVVSIPSSVTPPPVEHQSSCEKEDAAVADPEEEEEEETSKKKGHFEKTKQKLQKGFRRLSIGESIFPGNSQNRRLSLPITSSFNELKTKASSAPPNVKKSKKETKPKPERPSPSYMNMVDDKPELFASLEKLIPRPAKSFDDNPLYLCLRMGQPLKESSRYTPVVPFGHQMKSEYWFSIPRDRVDSLYFFFLRWAPQRYGDVDDIDMEELGFEPILEDEVLEEPPPAFVPSQRRSTWSFPWRRRKSDDVPESVNWEFVDNDRIQREPSLTESELSLPELSSPSNILNDEHLIKLNKHLPARAVGYAWELIYSTAVNGFSLKTLYREMTNYDSPVLIVIATTTGSVFGAMLSQPLHISDHFYGTGESYVFTFYPEFKHFPWSGENNYFIKGNTRSFAIGASDGQFGLWLDDDLYHGCSKECQTFKNDCLSDQEDFVVKSLEAWGFV